MSEERTELGRDLEEAFREMASFLRGDIEAETHAIVAVECFTPTEVKTIRRKVAISTEDFERQFHISAQAMEAYEDGRLRPDAAMQALLRVIDREPEAARRALGPTV